MQATDVVQSILRWVHVIAGVIWIGHLYFFNWVNGPMAAILDAETKKKVVPELMPRALFWFRYGALWTWITGILLLGLVFYHGGVLFTDPSNTWNVSAILSVVITFLGVFIFDFLFKTIGKKNLNVTTAIGIALIVGFVALMVYGAGFR